MTKMFSKWNYPTTVRFGAGRIKELPEALVWTGVKDTGKGAALSAIGYDNLTRPKSYHLREKI